VRFQYKGVWVSASIPMELVTRSRSREAHFPKKTAI